MTRPATSTAHELGMSFERHFGWLCCERGLAYKRQAQKSAYDYLVDGWRLELKAATPHKYKLQEPIWKFNVHRHGILDESDVDFYVLRLHGVPYSRYAIHLLIPAPLKTKVLNVSFRSLLNGDAIHAVEFKRFMRGEYGIGPLAKERMAA